MKLDVIYNEDCIDGTKKLPNESIDLIATDPPYGIGFMGKNWDKFNELVNPQGAYEKKKGFKKLPRQSSTFIGEFFTPIWKECLRVLKPGAFAFIMCIPRQDCLARQIISLEDAGFMVSFSSIYWAYASGFPKAQNIGKAVDKRLGTKRKVVGQKVRGDVEKAKRSGTTFAVADANKNNKDIFGYGIEDITLPATPQAQALDGSYAGFQPKPAVEVVIVAMKPLSEKTYVDQALKNGKGISWLDEGRIPYKGKSDIGDPKRFHKTNGGAFLASDPANTEVGNKGGRFPANLLVSDDALNDGKNISYGKSDEPYSYIGKKYQAEGFIPNICHQSPSNYGDSGSFSRYFSLDAWFEKKFKELPAGVQKTFPFLIVPKASKAEKNKGLEKKGHTRKCRWNNAGEWKNLETKKYGNNHPTVKPLKLFSYLITLGSREGDVILDPFIGSGTTAIAARMLGRYYIGYEINSEYCEIAKKRLSQVQLELL